MRGKLHTAFSTVLHRYLRIPYILNAKIFKNPKKAKATYVFIHGIGNSLHAWDEVIVGLPQDVQVVAIDLLGFGKSPKPRWVSYDAKTQSRSVMKTLQKLKLTHQPVLIGHSLGALIAVEIAKQYPLFIKEIVLCSPPFYKPEGDKIRGVTDLDDMLRSLYRLAKKHPDQLVKMSPIIVKLGLVNRAFSITKDTSFSYFAALESSIINQTSLTDIGRLRQPVMIFYGSFDPVVIAKHIIRLAKEHKTIHTRKVLAGHEVTGVYAKALARWLTSHNR